VSEIDSITRSGVSFELVLVTTTVQFTGSPILDTSVHSLVMAMPGWNRFTECESEALMSLGNPSGGYCAVAVFTSGSGSPATTVLVKSCDSHAPGASEAPKAALTPGISESVTLSLTRFGLSAELVLQTLIV